ncbi:hypothetical protein GCM10014713_30640 [Streptomyces purpureus]|uniref:Uncharacterized protein n=1 Tax=Streptomyces purpureus TaxID=1951 RepID=A0A918H5G8_9ACTN|nr:hypothetical protein GCM10014713_30640 [Streptomyces purpureus]
MQRLGLALPRPSQTPPPHISSSKLAGLGIDPAEIGEPTFGTARRHTLPCGGWFETQAMHRARPRLWAVVLVVPPPAPPLTRALPWLGCSREPGRGQGLKWRTYRLCQGVSTDFTS